MQQNGPSGYLQVEGLKLFFLCASLYFPNFLQRTCYYFWYKWYLKIHPSWILKTSPADMEQCSPKVRHEKEQMLPQERPAPEQPLKLHTLLPATDQRAVRTCCLLSATLPPKPTPVITYRAQALRKRQFLKNGMNWSCCQRTEWRCQVPSVMVSVPSTGCTCRIPKGEKM